MERQYDSYDQSFFAKLTLTLHRRRCAILFYGSFLTLLCSLILLILPTLNYWDLIEDDMNYLNLKFLFIYFPIGLFKLLICIVVLILVYVLYAFYIIARFFIAKIKSRLSNSLKGDNSSPSIRLIHSLSIQSIIFFLMSILFELFICSMLLHNTLVSDEHVHKIFHDSLTQSDDVSTIRRVHQMYRCCGSNNITDILVSSELNATYLSSCKILYSGKLNCIDVHPSCYHYDGCSDILSNGILKKTFISFLVIMSCHLLFMLTVIMPIMVYVWKRTKNNCSKQNRPRTSCEMKDSQKLLTQKYNN
ncbi:hypothetical protein SNEBB_011365 [Seison nebaliae]|nr:hypothetical protein SNEBB_011365 [Seison nebaliae]